MKEVLDLGVNHSEHCLEQWLDQHQVVFIKHWSSVGGPKILVILSLETKK